MHAVFLAGSAQLHNEVKRLKRKNNAYAKELSKTKELLQTDRSSIGRRGNLYMYISCMYVCIYVCTYAGTYMYRCIYKHVHTYYCSMCACEPLYILFISYTLDYVVAEEVDGVKAEKEKLEERCRELQRANSKLQNKVDELLKTTAHSISLQDHKAALDEIQGLVLWTVNFCVNTDMYTSTHTPFSRQFLSYRMVESFKADAESSKDELVHRIRVLEKEKKQLLNQLSGLGTYVPVPRGGCSLLFTPTTDVPQKAR